MKHFSALITTILLLLSAQPFLGQADNSLIKDIILINSYHPTFTWTKDITRGVVQGLPEKENYRVSIEHMDTKRFDNKIRIEFFKNYLKEKYKNIEINGVICSDNHAFEFVLEYSDEIWGKIPIVFCGVNNIKEYKNIDTLRIKGVDETLQMTETVRLIQKLQPELENLIVISDSSLTGQLFMNQFESTAQSEFPNLAYTPIYATTSETLENRLPNFSPTNHAVYLLSLYVERDGTVRSMNLETETIKEILDVPIYSNWDFMLNHGMLGGVLQRGIDQGSEAAKLMKKMLDNGASLPYLTKVEVPTVIDYEEHLRHFGKAKPLIPQVTYINKPLTFLEKNRTSLLVFSTITAIFILIITLLGRVISIKKLAEKEIRKGEERLELALEGANIGLWDFNFKTNDLYISEKVAELLGYKQASDLNFNMNELTELIYPKDVEAITEAYQLHLAGFTDNFKGEVRVKTAWHNYLWFSILGVITEKEGRNAKRMLGVIMNINNQKIFEEQLKHAKEKAEESDRLKSSFLANISHEIRTPMNAILGFSEILMQQPVDEDDTISYLKIIRSSGDSLLKLINDIIDISKMESEKLKLNPIAFDLHHLLDRINLMTRTIIHKQNRNVKFILKKGIPLDEFLITADRFRLEQVFNNLIANALKFTDKGYIELSYQVTDENKITFMVSDTGRGISPSDQKIIFERFRQAEDGSYESKGGTGLGLSITKNLIQLMGGEIKVVSELNKGAKFIFTIPMSPPTNDNT